MAENTVTSWSPFNRVKKCLRLSIPDFFRNKTSPDSKALLTKECVPNGYRSAPERLQFGQDFPHLKILRGVCGRSIGGDNYHVSTKYTTVYGAMDDLKETTDSKLESEEIEQRNISQASSCSTLFDKVHRGSAFTEETEARLRPSSKRRHSGPARYDEELQQTANLCDLKLSLAGKDTILKKQISINSEIDCISLDSTSSSSCSRFENVSIGMLSKESLHDLINFHTGSEPNTAVKETIMMTKCKIQENKCRMKITLQYFRNTRQLRIMLHKVEGLTESNCDIIVKLALFRGTSRQKTMTRTLHVSYKNADLNEVVYIEPQDGKVIGKLLRLRLCKVSKYFRRIQQIGEAVIALDDFETSIDTSVWLTLNKQLSLEMQHPSEYEAERVSEHSNTQDSERLMHSHSLAPDDLQLLIASSRAHHNARLRQQTS